jgi:hypothetical protein
MGAIPECPPPEVERRWMIEIIKTDENESMVSYGNDS